MASRFSEYAIRKSRVAFLGFPPEKLVKENELAAIERPAPCDRGAFDMVLQELVGKHARKCPQEVKPF